MNFGSFTHYLSSQIAGDRGPVAMAPPPPGAYRADSSEVSDWGIEEHTVPSSRHTSISHKWSAYGSDYPAYGQPLVTGPSDARSTQRQLQRFVRHYLGLHGAVGEFWERYKYELVVSNLLDDSMILSKNDQMLRDLTLRTANRHGAAHGAAALRVVGRQWRLEGAALPVGVLQCISMIFATLKGRRPTVRQTQVVLIVATRVMLQRRVLTVVHAGKAAGALEHFLGASYATNKRLMVGLLRLKEEEIYSFMGTAGASVAPSANASLLDNALGVLTAQLHHSVRQLLPHMNGPLLEKYCLINNVVATAAFDDTDPAGGEVQRLTRQLNRFNQVRKLLVCQLLAMDEAPSANFFLLQLCDHYGCSPSMEAAQTVPKLAILDSVLRTQTQLMESLAPVLAPAPAVVQDQDVLAMRPVTALEPSTPVSQTDLLIDRLTTLSTNLKFFQKYHQSTAAVTDEDEMNEKLLIYQQFGDELNRARELHQVSLHDLAITMGVDRRSCNSTSSSKRGSRDDEGNFNLKKFHTSTKRPLLPEPARHTPQSSPVLPTASSSPRESDKKHKRLSAGLPVGLVTVFEEPQSQPTRPLLRTALTANRGAGSDHGPVSCDGCPDAHPSAHLHDTYNQAALDSLSSLSRKHVVGAAKTSRYSLTSMNSNVSGITDLLTSMNLTSDHDDHALSTEDLKDRLEASFNRIYSLEHENLKLKTQFSSVDDADAIVRDNPENFTIVNDANSANFAHQLEASLQQRV